MIEKEKPALGAQEAVLGAMLIEPKVVPAILRKVTAEDFTDATCRNVFNAFVKLIAASKHIDAVTVLGVLGGEYRQYLGELMDITPTAAGWEAYAEQMRADAKMFRARKILNDFAFLNTPEEMQQAISKAASIFAGKSENVVPLSKALIGAMEALDKKPEYLEFGISALDHGRLWAEHGDFIIVGARPSVGKTAFALQIAKQLAKKNKVGFFTLETEPRKLATRWIAQSATINMTHLKNRQMSPGEYTAMAQANSQDSKYCSLDFVKAAGMTTDQIIAETIAGQYNVIVIDYIQLVRGSGERDENQRIANISMTLHTFAQQNGIAVIALSQLSRAGQNGGGMATLRGSGQLEQDADIVLMLELINPEDTDSDRTLSIEKNKEGRRGHCTLRFAGQYQHFEYVPPSKRHVDEQRANLENQEQIPMPQARIAY